MHVKFTQVWSCSRNRGSLPNMEVGATKKYLNVLSRRMVYIIPLTGMGTANVFLLHKKYMDQKSSNKFECIGHYQNCVGNKLKKKRKEKKLVVGKNRLTNAKTDILQNYFCIAIRQNIGKYHIERAVLLYLKANLCATIAQS